MCTVVRVQENTSAAAEKDHFKHTCRDTQAWEPNQATTFSSQPTNRLQPKFIITIVVIKLKLWLDAGCEAKVVAQLGTHKTQ